MTSTTSTSVSMERNRLDNLEIGVALEKEILVVDTFRSEPLP